MIVITSAVAAGADRGRPQRGRLQWAAVCAAWLAFAASLSARAESVALTNVTATFYQTEPWQCPPSLMIDGNTEYKPGAGNSGWSIGGGGEGKNQTAVFQSVKDIGVRPGGTFTFTIIQNADLKPHSALLARFRFAVTASDRKTFTDAKADKADWVLLYPDSFKTSNGSVLTEQLDYSLLLTKIATAGVDTFTVVTHTDLTNITGIRLETMTDASFYGGGGPGTYLGGNFVITEFQVEFQEAPVAKQ